jgi:hypothetical protein
VAFSVKRKPKAVKTPLDSRHAIEVSRDSLPEKLVIVQARPFGDALKLVLFGAALGAGGTFFALHSRLKSASSKTDAVAEGLSAGGAKGDSRALLGRLSSLAARLKGVAGAVGSVTEFAGNTVRPAVEAAMSEGKRTAREVEEELKRDLEEAKRETEAELAEAAKKREQEDKN